MSHTILDDARRGRFPRGRGAAGLRAAVLLACAAVLATGCASRDSIQVGSVPDDYRTNHPIVVSEQEKSVDIPVGLSDAGLSRVQRAAVDGFIAGYDRSAAPPVTVMVPYGSANQSAAATVSSALVARLQRAGVPSGRILHQSYEASRYGDAAPIRLVYTEMRASVEKCGRWPADMLDNADNKHWANYGCSYQNNLAAQIANPADLLGPRKPGPIDTERRNVTIDDYRGRVSEWDSEIGY